MEFGAHRAIKDSGSLEGLKRWCPPGRQSGPCDYPPLFVQVFTNRMEGMDFMGEKARQSQAKEPAPIRSRTDVPHVPYSYLDPHPLFSFHYLQSTLGNQATRNFLQSGPVQAKLTVGEPDDLYEQEADRVADAVMRMSHPGGISGQRSSVEKAMKAEDRSQEPEVRRESGIIQMKAG